MSGHARNPGHQCPGQHTAVRTLCACPRDPHWRQGRFTLLTYDEQFDEIRRVTRYPKIRTRILPALAGRMVNELRSTAETVSDLPDITISRDPWDNFLLALAEKGAADFLVTGDKADLLTLGQHRTTTIVTARQFLDRL